MESLPWRVVNVYSSVGISWFGVVLCFALFSRLAAKPMPSFQALGESAYSVYLFHNLPVVLGGVLVARVDWPLPVEFALICALACITSLGTHAVISRHPLLLFLFNGRRVTPRVREYYPVPIAA
jgi:membrane-bound acyltransferase YfiQ involved in biofilm formation